MDIFSDDILLSLAHKEHIDMLYEGLIVSYRINTVVSQLKRVYHVNNFNIIGTDKIVINIKNGLHPNKNELSLVSDKKFKKSLIVFGWYVAGYHYITEKNNFKPKIITDFSELPLMDDIMQLTMILEPKFDLFSPIKDKLYHVSPKLYRNKILKRGLIPKSMNNMFNYPSRIYCFDDKKYYLILTNKLVDQIPDERIDMLLINDILTYDLYEIKTDKMVIKWVKDVNLKGSYYTLENISKHNMKLINSFDIKIN